jgi:hypothetical protein
MEKPMSQYPVPDRSDFTPDQFRDDDTVSEGDIGAATGTLSDGRPYVCESWFTEGMTLVTFFFSIRDLEESSSEDLLSLLRPELEAAAVPEEFRRVAPKKVHKIVDASENEIYSLTFVVGMPEF